MVEEASGKPGESALTSGRGYRCVGTERARLRWLAPALASGLSTFESIPVASHRYPLFHTDLFNSNIGLPIPSVKPWQNAAKARNRRASDLRPVVLSALFTSSDPCHRKIRCAGFRHAAMAPRVISERSTREKFVTSSHPIGLRGLQENFLSSLAGRSGCANHYCRPGKSPWMQAVRLRPRAHSGAAFVPNKVRNSTKVDVRFVCRSTFSCPPSVTVKLCQVAPVAIPALPTTISDPGTRS